LQAIAIIIIISSSISITITVTAAAATTNMYLLLHVANLRLNVTHDTQSVLIFVLCVG